MTLTTSTHTHVNINMYYVQPESRSTAGAGFPAGDQVKSKGNYKGIQCLYNVTGQLESMTGRGGAT